MARVSSIRLLSRAAQLGDMKLIEQAIERVGQTLNTSAKWEKGIQYDYEAMIAAYVNAYGVEKFLNNPDPFFQIVGLSEQTALAVERGLYDSQMRAVPPQVWREKLGHYFAEVQTQPISSVN